MNIAKGWITRELDGIGLMGAAALREKIEMLPDDHISFYLLDGLDLMRMSAGMMSASLLSAAELAAGQDVSSADAELMLSDLYDRLTRAGDPTHLPQSRRMPHSAPSKVGKDEFGRAEITGP